MATPNSCQKVLIIDPCQQTPEVGAYNRISHFVSKRKARVPEFGFDGVVYHLPSMAPQNLSEILKDLEVGGVILLGSFANVTDQKEWIPKLAQDLQTHIIGPKIPLLAICFGHQLLAKESGAEVNFVRRGPEKDLVSFYEFRESEVTHPLFRLLLTQLQEEDYFGATEKAAAFQKILSITRPWNGEQWDQLARLLAASEELGTSGPLSPFQTLNSEELRFVAGFMAHHSPSRFVAHARHEQEVISLPSSASHWKLAARSKDCPWEALVHENGLVFTTQTHPETPHASGDGERLIRNFLLLASFFRELAQ